MAIRTIQGDLLAVRTPSAASTVDFDSELVSGYSRHLLVSDGFTVSTTSNVEIRFGVSGSYTDTANSYSYRSMRIGSAATPTDTSSSNTVDAITIHDTLVSADSEITHSMKLDLYEFLDSGVQSYIRGVFSANDQNTQPNPFFVQGNRNDPVSENSIRLLLNAGTITGTFKLYGIR